VGRIGSWPARAGTQRPMARRSNLHRGLLTQDWAWPTARWPDLLAAHGAGAHARGSVRSARSACAWHGGVGRRPSGTGRGNECSDEGRLRRGGALARKSSGDPHRCGGGVDDSGVGFERRYVDRRPARKDKGGVRRLHRGSKTVALGLERTNAAAAALTREGGSNSATVSVAASFGTSTSCAWRRMGAVAGCGEKCGGDCTARLTGKEEGGALGQRRSNSTPFIPVRVRQEGAAHYGQWERDTRPQ
jgi:hypothetical protein